ncbi:hypothetical protein KPL74_14575 [Bacillus sp. NP157]|nr:hypothetical protein KPL74_14575 [Bacillus sp. NP157]
MNQLLLLVAAIGVVPLIVGLVRLDRGVTAASSLPGLASTLWCAFAFNLTFFWQELWLFIPKALTPGLSPVLYHNNHDWSGEARIAELLQGTGALATLASGIACLAWLSVHRRLARGWQLFLFWMAFQGLFQSLSQCAIGAIIPGNDVGRALAFLGAGVPLKALVLAAAIIAMRCAGILLARFAPAGLAQTEAYGSRRLAYAMLVSAVACVIISIPFREPRDLIEVVMIPAIVNLVGAGWFVLGISPRASAPLEARPGGARWYFPAVLLALTLAVFQLVLRHGIRF